MHCRFFATLSAISLLVCFAIAVSWVQSYSDAYYADWRQQDRGVVFYASMGRMSISRYRMLPHHLGSDFVGFEHGRFPPDNIDWNTFGPRLHLGSFAAGRNNAGGFVAFTLIVPHWLFVLLTAIAPGCWLVARLSHHREKRGFEPLPQPPPANKSPPA